MRLLFYSLLAVHLVVKCQDDEGFIITAYRTDTIKDRLGELLLLGLSQIKIQEALLLYQRGLVSFGRAAELAGLSEEELALQARAFGVYPRWAETMVEEDVA